MKGIDKVSEVKFRKKIRKSVIVLIISLQSFISIKCPYIIASLIMSSMVFAILLECTYMSSTDG